MHIDRHEAVDHFPVGLIFGADRQYSTELRTTQVLILANDMMPDDNVAECLEENNFCVKRVQTIDSLIALTRNDHFDVIVVDFRPDLLGYQAVSRLRLAHVEVPVLFVSARSSSDAFDRAYAVGADEIIVFPFNHLDLKACVLSLANRSEAACPRSQIVRVGPLEIDLAGRQAHVDGKSVRLFSDEYLALELLVSRNGAPVRKSTILSQDFDDDILASHANVDSLIGRLRRKLVKAGAGDLIRNVWGFGYALSVGGSNPITCQMITS